MRSLKDCLLRPCAAVLWSPGFCRNDALTPNSGRRPEGESTDAVSDFDSSPDALPVEKCRDSCLLSLVVLLGKDKPGNPSPPVVSILGLGVDAGSTDTTDRIGKTRSVADGLIAPNGDSDDDNGFGELVPCLSFCCCGLDLDDPRCVSKPHSFESWGRESEKER